MTGKYVYCVIKADGGRKSFGNIGFGEEEVYTIRYKDFAAVVSDSPVKEYEATEEDVEIHKRVAEKVMKDYSVLPVAYGMVFKNKKLLLLAMNKARKPMKKAMKAVDNGVELGVKAIIPKESSISPPVDGWASDIFEYLKRKAVESKKLRLFSQRLILNASFLVERDKIEEFSKEVGGLKDKYGPLKIQYTGPWPPYNFVDIHILGKRRGGFR